MKKYLQYNTVHFRENQSDVGVGRPQGHTPEGHLNEHAGSLALDLSGRPTINSVAKVTDQKGGNEQESALDLSRHGAQETQEEALDLSKPSAPRQDRHSSQSFLQAHPINQSQHSLQTPPVSRHSKSPAGQPYSLLQAALNSSQPNAGLHTAFDRLCQSTAAMLEQRAMVFSTAGMPVADYGRTIKPFSNMSSRPLGITRPNLSHPSGAVIQGMHKPIAITAPQPHNSSVNTKSQSVSDTTVSVTDANHSVSSTCNQGYAVSQSNYTSGHQSQISRQLNSGKIGIKDAVKNSDYMKDPDMVERYLIKPPKGLNNFVGNVNVIPTEALAGFSCNQCSKTFKTKAALKLHTTVHKTAEERQYACTICCRRFLHRHHLVVHQRKHSGEKPFKCTACSKSFMAIFLLHKHLRKHTRESGPVSQISTEQLKQLHDNKILPNRQSFQSAKTAPVTSDNNPVIVLDDDDDEVKKATVEMKVNEEAGKLDRKRYERHMNHNILDMIEKDPKMILEQIKADFLKNNTENANKGQDEKTNEQKVQMEIDSKSDGGNNEENQVTDLKEATVTHTNGPEVSQMGEINHADVDIHIKEEDVENTYNYIIKDSDESKENFEESEENTESIDNGVKIEESTRTFPVYGSDDEVELDFTTGEIKVLGKKICDGTDNIEMSKTEECVLFEKNIDVSKNEIVQNQLLEEKNVTANEIKAETEDLEVDRSNTENDDIEVQNEAGPAFEPDHYDKNDKMKEEVVEREEIGISSQGNTTEEDTVPILDKRKTEHESGNIFEKLSDMQDVLNVPGELNIKDVTVEEDTNKVDKEVETIIGIIKQKVCENVEELCVVAKRPKLDDIDESKITTEAIERAPIKWNGMKLSRSRKQSRQKKGKKKGKKVKCEICSRTFHSNHYLVLHMAVHRRNPMLQALKKAKDYQMKAMGFLNKTNVTCEVCKKVFKFQKSLNSHMRVHSEKMIQTKLYRKAFRDFMAEAAPHSSRTSEKEKSQTLSSESESQGRRFSAGGKVTDRDIGSVFKQVSCDHDISSTLTDEQYEDPPIKVIIGEDNVKRYLCHACDNTYTTRQKLRMHALIHKDNCFLCDVCGKSFFRHITLEKHISTHMLPRPHVCDICKKSFIHRSSLMRHKVVHDKAAAPSVKQQVADFNFEMKMLDTYTMLRHERMQKMQIQKLLDAAKTEQASLKASQKYNPLDLTVRIKNEDNNLPPVLSPVSATVPTATQVSPWNLSPPLITHETNGELNEKNSEKCSVSKGNKTEYKVSDFEHGKGFDMHENRKNRTESTCSESDLVTVEGHQVVKKRSRKTRVYQTSCRVCKEVFPNVMLLKSHMVVHNTVETHLYECHICRHRFTQSCSLLRHLKTSCQENRMKCVPCGRTFHRRNTYEQHMRLHQGGLPNLDGSFYDKRPDEAGMIEERESDIENNNLSKLQEAFVLRENSVPLREEIVNVIGNDPTQNVTIIKQGDGNDSDSDARTYLYSEGEVHSRYNSDFSDNEWSPPQSPKKLAAPQDLSATSGNMTLNLLSAVCSDIRNAEKEEELKRRELEEKQKELETIEILANLKRGAIQKSSSSSESDANIHSISTLAFNYDKIVNPLNSVTDSLCATDVRTPPSNSRTVISKHLTDENKEDLQQISQSYGQKTLHSEPKHTAGLSFEQKTKLPSVIEGHSASSSEPKIPTVVLEVVSEAERLRQKRLEIMWQDRPFIALPTDQVSTVPFTSTLNSHHTLGVQPSPVSNSQSAPLVQNSSSNLTSFAQGLLAKTPHLLATSSHSAPVGPPPGGRSPHTSIAHSSGMDQLPSKEMSLQHEMSQMKVHYPAIQERLSLLMKAQVTTASGSPQIAQNRKVHDISSSSSMTTSIGALPSSISTTKALPSLDNDMPQDLSLKKVQETKTATNIPGSKSKSSRSFSIEALGPSRTESKQLENLMSLPQEMPLPHTHGMRKSNSLKSLPVEISRLPITDIKTEFPRSGSSMSLPSEGPASSNNEHKRSESVPVQPPLVPMHQCELCTRVLYNKTDLQLHMMEHGRSAGELYKLLHSNRTLLEQKRLPTKNPLDFTKTGTGNGFGGLPVGSKASPPISLDLSSKKKENKMKAFNETCLIPLEQSPGTPSKYLVPSFQKVEEKSSPISSSDLSDSLPSPSTPSGPGQSAASIDALRQELRLKIYARRRSQGLDDLKVEFKPPEPAEMTESERLKLMYRRECNRQAAQRSRMRKKDLVDSLLEDLHKEEVVHSDLQRKMEALVAEKNFLLKVYKSHNCVKGLVKPSDNHSLFEALNHKDDVVAKDKADDGSAKVLVPPVNLEDHTDENRVCLDKIYSSKETEKSNDYAEKNSDYFKKTSVAESPTGYTTDTKVENCVTEDNLEDVKNDTFHDKSAMADHYDESSETSDDIDSPILKLLKDKPDTNKDNSDSECSLIKDNVDDT